MITHMYITLDDYINMTNTYVYIYVYIHAFNTSQFMQSLTHTFEPTRCEVLHGGR